MSGFDAEARRQQALLQVLWRRAPDSRLDEDLAGTPRQQARGLAVYRANGLAHARRALADGFPVLRALMAEEPFDALAADYWQSCPPQHGDLAWAGQHLPAFIEAQPALADWPYLADVARLEWALLRAGAAQPPARPPPGLTLLAEGDPADLYLEAAPALAVVASRWPVACIHAAHAPGAGDAAFERARTALAAAHGEAVLVWRDGLRPCCTVLEPASLAWWQALCRGASVDLALREAGAGFDFQAWLVDALVHGWLGAVRSVAGDGGDRTIHIDPQPRPG